MTDVALDNMAEPDRDHVRLAVWRICHAWKFVVITSLALNC